MYLKRISIQGFKSFPDRVDFDFARGVTCIVGPNGCGKSNVVDAFKWVLGEQSAKLLRGRQMTDMIFNGSTSRRSSGMAKVDLYFDNSQHMLPIEYDEVCVSRKLYRSGESEYLINNETVRLKDVRELFLDSGVGSDTYSIIEQGRVELLLTSSSVERRAIFEEAAGIGKYKARKLEAQRKLERTQQNLLRVRDIIEEVQKRLRSVKLAAGKARNYQAYAARLNELRAGYSLAEYHRLTQAVERLRAAADGATDDSTAVRTGIDRNEAEASRLAATANQLAEEVSTTEQELLRTRSELATHEERIDAANKRIEEQHAAIERIDARVGQLSAQQQQYLAQLEELEAQARDADKQTEENGTRIAQLTVEEQGLDRAVTQERALLDDEKDGLVDLVRRSTHLRNQIAGLNSQSETLKATQSRLGERDAAIRAEIEQHLRRKASLESRKQEVEALIQTETERLHDKSVEAQALETRRAELSAALGEAKERRSALNSRLEVLAELAREMEGVGAGVRRLLELKASRPDDPVLAGVCGMVGDLFEADVEYARVIEAAIGEFDQFLVLEDSSILLAHGDLFADLPGRLTALCLDRLPPVIHEHEPFEHPAIVAIASDLVHCKEPYERLVKHLLGKSVVVRTLEDALSLAKDDLAGRRFITLAGEVVEPNGSVSLGPPSSRAGLVARKSERRDLGSQLEGVQERARELDESLNRAAAEAVHLREVQEDLRGAVNEATAARAEATAALEAVNEAIRRLTREQPLIVGEVQMIEQQLAEAAQRASESQVTVGELEAQNAQRERSVVSHLQRIESLSVELDRARHALTEARISAGKLATRRASLADALNHLRHGVETAEQGVAAAHRERDECHGRIRESEDRVGQARRRMQELAAAGERLEAGVMQLRRRREMVRVESEELASRTRALRTRLEEIETRLHEIRLEQQESTVRRDELVTRVRDELNMDLVELYRSYEHNEQDWEEVEAEIAELRQKIARLGSVNLDAITEQEELETREQFLTSQWDDLEDSRRQLEDLIGKLDAQSVARFTEAFETIRGHFRDLFRKLFGGGKADIVLENPDDILESGIEILAKPPGKELQRISLMSGGEKTMTAIALLMSIFRSRPSPLALLDEVDAALDEANNARFNQLVQEFLDRSQFVLVTHSKRTMAIADHLYGITMQEPGVSARVSVKFEDGGERSAVA